MSRPATAGAQVDVETAVRNRSQFADTLHRQDPESDEPRPACPEGEYRTTRSGTDAPAGKYLSTWVTDRF